MEEQHQVSSPEADPEVWISLKAIYGYLVSAWRGLPPSMSRDTLAARSGSRGDVVPEKCQQQAG